ncbi:MAG: hypothetical protein AAFZ49_00165 [Cyanobacteria bacterium J06659_2]
MTELSRTVKTIANLGYYPLKLYSAVDSLTPEEFKRLAELIAKVERNYSA